MIFSILSFFLFLIDRLIKNYIFNISFNQEIFLIPKVLSLKLYKNFGAAFSLPIPVEIIILLSFALIFFILLGVRYHSIGLRRAAKTKEGYLTPQSKIQKNIPRFVLLFLIFGAASNIFDRIYYGYVIDYFSLFNYSFFNLADLMIIFSLGFVLYYYWKK